VWTGASLHGPQTELPVRRRLKPRQPSTAEQCPQTPAPAEGGVSPVTIIPWGPITRHRRGRSTNPGQQKMERWSFTGQGRNSQLEGERKGSRRSPSRGGGAALSPSGASAERDELASVAQSAKPQFLVPEKWAMWAWHKEGAAHREAAPLAASQLA
jgi:hypothetical protein